MELLQLKYFRVVATNEHIARSAQQLNVSQPAISLMISRLEQELGVQLFDRVGRRIVLNEFGAAFLGHIDKILREEENARLEMQEMLKREGTSISIALTSPHLLDGIILPFIDLYPDLRWKLRVADTAQCISWLKSGAVDFCISSPGIWCNGVATRVCIEDELMVAASRKHPFSGRQSVGLEEISGERMIMLVGDYAFRHLLDDIFSQYGMRLNYHIECNHLLRNRLVEENQGISISMRSAKGRKLYDDKVCLIPIEAENFPRTQITICRMKDRYLSTIVRTLMDYIVDFYQNINCV